MTVYTVMTFRVLEFYHPGWYILSGCGIHRTPGDEVGGRLGF